MRNLSAGVQAGILAFVIAALALVSIQILNIALRILIPALIIAAAVYTIVEYL